MAITEFPITTVPATASNVAYTAIAPLSANNVQNAINELAGFIPSSVFGIIPVSSLSPPVLPNGSDQSSNLQTAIDSYTSTGVTLQFGAGTYIFNSAIVLKPNIILRGLGMDITILKAGVDGISVIDRWGSVGSDMGVAGVEDLTVYGFADRNGYTQSAHKLVSLGPFNYYWLRDVKAIYSIGMGLAGIGGSGLVEGCVISKCLRDGINLGGTNHTSVINNEISEIGDDAIAVPVPAGASGINQYSTRIIGNRIEKSFGIKVLGARNTTISDNVIRFYSGYGIFVGIDEGFGEGLITKFSINVANNTIVDGLNADNFGAGSIGSGIFLLGSQSLGTGGTAIGQYVGQYDGVSAVQTPDAFINKAGAAQPRGPDGNISIVGNNIRQTIDGTTNFSDAGFGDLWYNNGPVDPAIDGLIGEVRGITLNADLENSIIANNVFHGVLHGIETNSQLNNVSIHHNNFFRFTGNGINLVSDDDQNGSISIDSNLFDSDPYNEDSHRTVPIDGTWDVTDGSSRMGIIFDSYNGVSITRNRFRNCIRAIKYINGSYIDEQNILECGVVNGGGGIAAFSNINAASNIFWFVETDPTDPNYNLFSEDFVLAADSIPTAGVYRRGAFVKNNLPALDGNNMVILGWIRLTTGNAHVQGTDWAVARVSHVLTGYVMATFGTVLAQPSNIVLVTVLGEALGTEQTIIPPPEPSATITRGGYVPTDWPSAGKPFKYS